MDSKNYSFKKIIPNWTTLKFLGTSKVVKSANFWAVCVPIVAKLFSQIQSPFNITLLGNTFCVEFSLPFSWKVFFIAAIAFFVANIVFSFFCPPLLKQTINYRDFQEQGRSGSELQRNFEMLWNAKLLNKEDYEQWINWLNARKVSVSNARVDYGTPAESDERAFTEIYTIVTYALDILNLPARIVACFFYAFGLIAFGTVLFQNVAYVAKQW